MVPLTPAPIPEAQTLWVSVCARVVEGYRTKYFRIKALWGEVYDAAFSATEAWNNRAQGNMTSPVLVGNYAYLYLRAKRFADEQPFDQAMRSTANHHRAGSREGLQPGGEVGRVADRYEVAYLRISDVADQRRS